MLKYKKIKIGGNQIETLVFRLKSKNLVVLKGKKGYIMCGYLNLKAAEKFKEPAVKIVGVAGIADALKATVHSCSSSAKKLGIYKGQPVQDVLKIIV